MIRYEGLTVLLLLFFQTGEGRHQCSHLKAVTIKSGGHLCAQAYHHFYCKGQLSEQLDIPEGKMELRQVHNDKIRQVHNDKISSVVVLQGCHLTIYEHSGKKGYKKTLEPGIYDRLDMQRRGMWDSSHWNDVISSLECYCKASLRIRPKERK